MDKIQKALEENTKECEITEIYSSQTASIPSREVAICEDHSLNQVKGLAGCKVSYVGTEETLCTICVRELGS